MCCSIMYCNSSSVEQTMQKWQLFSANFLITPRISKAKHMLWVLKRTVSMRRFFWAHTTYLRIMKNNIQVTHSFLEVFNSLSPGKFFMLFCRLLVDFEIIFFRKIISGRPSECQTDWIQIRPDILSGLILVQTVCKSYQQTTLGDKELTVSVWLKNC